MANQDDNNKKKEDSIGVFKIILLIIVGALASTVGRKFSRELRNNLGNHQITNTAEFKKATDNALSELDNKFNQYDTNEELYTDIKKQVKDDEVAGASAFDGFILSAQIIEEYCKSTGYIPQRYISMVKSYKKTNDFEEKLIASSVKLGATREQAIIILDKSRKLIKQQIIKSTERDYLEIKKEEPSYTKKEYCKLYDSNTKEIISYKINEIKKHMPNAYRTYFQMK